MGLHLFCKSFQIGDRGDLGPHNCCRLHLVPVSEVCRRCNQGDVGHQDAGDTVVKGPDDICGGFGVVEDMVFGVEHLLGLSDGHGQLDHVASGRALAGRGVYAVVLQPGRYKGDGVGMGRDERVDLLLGQMRAVPTGPSKVIYDYTHGLRTSNWQDR